MQQPKKWLVESAERFRALCSAAPVGIFVSEPGGRCVYANAALEHICAIPAAELLEQGWMRSIHPQDRDWVTARVAENARSRGSFDDAFRLLRDDGQVRWIHVWTAYMHGADGEPAGLVGVVLDITEQKVAEQQLRFTQFSVDQAVDAIFWINHSGRFIYVNQAAQQLTGYGESELLSMAVGDIDVHYPKERWPSVWRDFQLRGSNTFESELRHENGRVFPVEITARMLHYGGRQYICAYVRDVTSRKEAEAVVRRHQDALAHASRVALVGEMGSALAHELNQPLAAVNSYLRGCLLRLQREQQPELAEALEQALEQARRASGILQRMWSFTKKGGANRTLVAINDMVHSAVRCAEMDLRQAGVHVELRLHEGLPLVSCEAIQIEQVIVNLLRNAQEAMADACDGARRHIVIETRLHESGDVMVSVHDSGPGFGQTHPPEMFEPFCTTKANGMGLGLAISRSIVTHYGGRIWALHDQGRANACTTDASPNRREETTDRATNCGATVCFTLPAERQSAQDDG